MKNFFTATVISQMYKGVYGWSAVGWGGWWGGDGGGGGRLSLSLEDTDSSAVCLVSDTNTQSSQYIG